MPGSGYHQQLSPIFSKSSWKMPANIQESSQKLIFISCLWPILMVMSSAGSLTGYGERTDLIPTEASVRGWTSTGTLATNREGKAQVTTSAVRPTEDQDHSLSLRAGP